MRGTTSASTRLRRGCGHPIVKDIPKDFLKTLSPMGAISEPKDIADAVMHLTEARHITGEPLRVDGGMHVGKW
jgi:NAD(P)-dependent dehydrogenase (short-subunit alcohol dehydrogenase family)